MYEQKRSSQVVVQAKLYNSGQTTLRLVCLVGCCPLAWQSHQQPRCLSQDVGGLDASGCSRAWLRWLDAHLHMVSEMGWMPVCLAEMLAVKQPMTEDHVLAAENPGGGDVVPIGRFHTLYAKLSLTTTLWHGQLRW